MLNRCVNAISRREIGMSRRGLLRGLRAPSSGSSFAALLLGAQVVVVVHTIAVLHATMATTATITTVASMANMSRGGP